MDHSIAIPALVAFFITLILGPGLISFLHKLKFGQFIREEGPESHLKRNTNNGWNLILSGNLSRKCVLYS